MRLTPIFIPFAALNYALGLSRVKLRDFVLASWLGMLPATIRNVYLGSTIHDLAQLLRGDLSGVRNWERLVFWGGLAATLTLVVFISRIARQTLQEESGLNLAASHSGEKIA